MKRTDPFVLTIMIALGFALLIVLPAETLAQAERDQKEKRVADDDEDEKLTDADKRAVKFSLSAARKIALERVAGTVVDEELEKENGRLQYAIVVERKGRPRAEHDKELIVELKQRGVELVCLAGYMRLLSLDFIRAFPNRIVNIHPSLLPAFPGLNVQQLAIDHGVKISGCTVHFVNENLDAGPIILQRAVPVKGDDTAESLAARILLEEHPAYVEAVRLIVTGGIEVVGNKTVMKTDQRTASENY